MVKLTAEQVWNDIRDDEAHGISRYSSDGSQGGFTYDEARDLGFVPPNELPKEDQVVEFDIDEEPSETETSLAQAAVSASGSPATVERFVKRDIRLQRARRGKKLSDTPDAKRARARRDKKKVQVAQNISDNADPWGR